MVDMIVHVNNYTGKISSFGGSYHIEKDFQFLLYELWSRQRMGKLACMLLRMEGLQPTLQIILKPRPCTGSKYS